MTIQFTKSFTKSYRKLGRKLQLQCDERIALFAHDPSDPRLNIHQLKGEWEAYCSINITGDNRAIFYEKHGDIAIFVAVGTHSQLYG